MHKACLRLESVEKRFQEGEKETIVLRGLNIAFNQGHTYAIMGVSGSGKSTIIQMLAGLDIPSRGTASFNGRSLRAFTPAEYDNFLQTKVGLLFQEPYLFAELSVIENVVLPARINGQFQEEVEKRAEELLCRVGISHKRNKHPRSLSGGEQTRAALARALINQPTFLLADEPTGNLDRKSAQAMIELLCTLQKDWKMGLIICTHDQLVAQAMEHRYELKNGAIAFPD